MLADIGHPYARRQGRSTTSPSRTCRPASAPATCSGSPTCTAAIVVGTGDLSELALGWSTYGVGDHMSHYNVNASVPKTLIKHLVRWVAGKRLGRARRRAGCSTRSSTPRSAPSSCPGDAKRQAGAEHRERASARTSCRTSTSTTMLRYGFAPTQGRVPGLDRVARREQGAGPTARRPRNAYTLAEIKTHLRIFLRRFFKTSQFKRSCVPNAPKVGSGGSLSPRGDWRAPSDSEATVWLDELETVPDA